MQQFKKYLALSTMLSALYAYGNDYNLGNLEENLGSLKIGKVISMTADGSTLLYTNDLTDFIHEGIFKKYNINEASEQVFSKEYQDGRMSSSGQYTLFLSATDGLENIFELTLFDNDKDQVYRLPEDINTRFLEKMFVSDRGNIAFEIQGMNENSGYHGYSYDFTAKKLVEMQSPFSGTQKSIQDVFIYGLSRDGKVAVGSYYDDSISPAGSIRKSYGDRAGKWDTQTGAFTALNIAYDYSMAEATAVNQDGSVIAGFASLRGDLDKYAMYLWENGSLTAREIYQGSYAVPLAMTAQGNMIGGTTMGDDLTHKAFYWREDEGFVVLKDKLKENNIALEGIELANVTSISDDGSTLLVQGTKLVKSPLGGTYNRQEKTAFLTKIPATKVIETPVIPENPVTPETPVIPENPVTPNNPVGWGNTSGIGIISIQDSLQSIHNISAMSSHLITSSASHNVSLLGVDHFNVDNKVISFATAAAGRYNDDSAVALSRIGAGYQVTPNFYMGATLGLHNINGEMHNNGEYSSNGIQAGLWGGYNRGGRGLNGAFSLGYITGDIDTERRFYNGSALETAHGSTNYNSYALSTRVGYGFHVKRKITLNPFFDITYGKSNIDGFVEKGSNFPAEYGEQTATFLQTHMGLEGRYALSQKFDLSGQLAWGHGESSDIEFSGNLIENNKIVSVKETLPQESDDWVNLGLGLDYKVNNNISIGADVIGNLGVSSNMAPNIASSFSVQFSF